VSILGFYFDIVRALEEIGALYMLVGAFAGSAFGITRATFDVDILVDLRESHFNALAHRFPLPRYYADAEQMRNSTRLGIMFNIIDTSQGVKADLVPLSGTPAYLEAFARRTRRTFQDESGQEFEAWCARPEDIILGKLMAWQEGRSAKHPADIREMLVFILSGLSDEELDLGYVSTRAAQVGTEAGELWQVLLNQAKAEISSRDHPTDSEV
jgi:hypothetical protein